MCYSENTMSDNEIFYENLLIKNLYIFSPRSLKNKDTILLLYKNPCNNQKEKNELVGFIGERNPFTIIGKNSIDENHSYMILHVDFKGNPMIGWIDPIEVISEDLIFEDATMGNTEEYTDISWSGCVNTYELILKLQNLF